MFIEFHLFYAMLWIPLLVSLMFFKYKDEEFQRLNKGLKFYYRLFPYLCILLIYLYPFMHAEVFTDSPVAFVKRLGFLLIGATYINALLLLLRRKEYPSIGIRIISPVCYLVLMVGWNIYVHSSVFAFIINMLLALLAIFPMYLIAVIISGMALTKTKEQREFEAEVEERKKELLAKQEDRRRQQEEIDRKRREERDERDRKTTQHLHELEAQGKLPKYSGKQWTPKNEEWDSDDATPKRKSVWDILTEGDFSTNRASGGNCCDNCSHYWGGTCHNPASDAYGQFIMSSKSKSCMFHG